MTILACLFCCENVIIACWVLGMIFGEWLGTRRRRERD